MPTPRTAGNPSPAPSSEDALVEELPEDDENRAHHLEPDRDVQKGDYAAGEQAPHDAERDEVLQESAGEHDSPDPDQREARRPERLRDLHPVDGAAQAEVQVRARQVDEQEGAHQDHASLEAASRCQVAVRDD